ncbi:MAG TPA: hypothetical protein VHE37_07580 [Nevskiaceae bacterium]|nr:hypothetical protein [Nevskiaceae bacterium]
MNDRTRAGRRQFLLVALLFAAPLVAAWLLYFVFPQWQPKARSNYGEVISPARPVPALALYDAEGRPAAEALLHTRWTLLYLGGAQCAQACQDALLQTRQIRVLLNQNRDRVQRVYLAPDAAALATARAALPLTLHQDLLIVAEKGAATSPARNFFQPVDADAVYLIDPLGNWAMTFHAGSDYKKVLKDLKYLLQLSHIG